ncbi:MAG: SNF2 helicase associated domain-containing protein, partial [Lachnospiraceae bacterium]|nr:SNF2 helicase associated domain-containing protein [Lachnospiraceae bacterium]
MNFSLESIRSKVDGDKALAKGRTMAENGCVVLEGISAVGNRETEIKGVVGGVAEPQEKHNTKLIINDGNIRLFTCSCVSKGVGMCVHCTATAFAYYRHLYQNTAMRTSTAQFMKDTMDNYIRYRVFEEMEPEEGTILLLPKIMLGNLQGMSFKLSNGNNEYLISDLGEFYNRMKSGVEHEYGKQLVMKHNALVFEKESRTLLALLLEAIEEEAEASAEYAFKSKAVVRRKCLSLKRSYMDDIAKTFADREIELELPDKTKTHVIFKEENPEVVLRIKETLLGGYRLESDRAMYSFMLGRRLCVCPAPFTEAFLCDAEYTRFMAGLLVKMNADSYREDNFTVGKRDMAMFCGQMLPVIKDY